MHKNKMSNLAKANNTKKCCNFCSKEYTLANINKHEKACGKNPTNMKECPVCKTMHSKKGVTCSYSCSNTHFRSGKDNPNWKEDRYNTTCWLHHGKKCLVCGEEKIVAVHHVNENHDDNRPENLVPLCPTHHQYVHSRYRDEVQPIIDAYVKSFTSEQLNLVEFMLWEHAVARSIRVSETNLTKNHRGQKETCERRPTGRVKRLKIFVVWVQIPPLVPILMEVWRSLV